MEQSRESNMLKGKRGSYADHKNPALIYINSSSLLRFYNLKLDCTIKEFVLACLEEGLKFYEKQKDQED